MHGGFKLVPGGMCVMCHAQSAPILVSLVDVDPEVGICEPCARLADWRFRRVHDAELAGAPFPTVTGASLVLVVRDRTVDGHPDTLCPRDVLMVERPGEPGEWGLPGGRLEPGEASGAAAVREAARETGISTWQPGLELLHSGFSARGRLIDVFLCRAYAGTPEAVEGEGKVLWKPWPPSQHAGFLRGYYRGLEEAFETRLRLHRALGNEAPLCQRLGRSAFEYVVTMLDRGDGVEDVRRHMEALTYVMSEEEKQAAKIVLREVLAPKLPEPKERPAEEAAPSEMEDDSGLEFGEDEGREGP